MIRARKPRRDDRIILDLIKRELFVFSVATKPGMRWDPVDVRKRLNRNVTFVAVPGRSKPVGFASVHAADKDMLLDMLAVDRGSQGQGWGSALLKEAENYARSQGCRAMKLFVDAANGKARIFYARQGYAEQHYYPTLSYVAMAKAL